MGTTNVCRIILLPFGKGFLPWLKVLAAPMCMVLLFACSDATPRQTFTTSQRAAVDSVVKRCRNIDSLKILFHYYERNQNTLGQIVALRELGRLYRNNSQFDKALKANAQGLEVAEQAADTIEMVQAQNNIGTNYRRLGLLDMASEYHYKALNTARAFSDSLDEQARKNLVVSLNGLGNIYLTLGDEHLADSVFRAALAGEQKLGSTLGQAINYANLGSIFEKSGQTDSAWAYYRKSLDMNKEAGSELGVSLCHNHFGRLYENEQRYEEALREYAQSYDMMKESRDEWHWLESCISIARVHVARHDYAMAATYLAKGMNVATTIKSMEHEAQIHQLYYEIYRSTGNNALALDHFVRAKECNDSVVNLKKVNEIQNLRMSIERARQESRFNLAQKNLELERVSKHTAWFALLVVVLLAAVLIAFIWYALRTRIRTVKILRDVQTVRENFFTNITHEFRTPLTVILGQGQLLKNSTADNMDQVHAAATMIERQGNSLLTLINQLLDIAKVKSAIGNPDWRQGNVVAYVAMLVESFADYARQKKIALNFRPAENEVQMDFVPNYMNKVMRNLLSNAFKYTPEGGRIEVSTRLQASTLDLRVADSGVGIDAKNLPHVFEPFFQGKEDSQKVGTGVGLSLVRDIVETMGGKISVESQPGNGTTFVIKLPLHAKGALEQKNKAANASAQPLPPVSMDEATIGPVSPLTEPTVLADDPLSDDETATNITRLLIVEDNNDVAYYIGQQLREKYAIAYATDGEQGLQKAMEMVPDLIITDLMMPGIDGYELCKRVRRSELLNHVPVIMVTARSTEEDRIRGLEAGVDAYLYKPFNSEELNVRVEKLLDQRRLLREKYSQAIKQDNTQSVAVAPAVSDFIRRIDEVIMQLMPSGDVNLQSVSGSLCLSTSQFRRKLFATTGETPANYITMVRMRQARRLLTEHAEMNVGEVATACGYDDNSHFTRVFRQVYDITPTELRRNQTK